MTRHYAVGMDIFTEAENVREATQLAVYWAVKVDEAGASLVAWPISGDELARFTRG